PDVVGGTEKLVQLRQTLGALYGDPVDPAGDTRLDMRWKAFGQPRSCCFLDGSCGDAGAGPTVDLGCPDAGTDGGTAGGADAKADATHGDAAPEAGRDSSSSPDGAGDDGGAAGAANDESGGCGSRAASGGTSFASFFASLVAALAFVRRRRPD